MGQINTEQAVQIIEAVGNAKAQVAEATTTMHAEPNMDFGTLALLALLPMIAGGVVAWFKRHIIIGWVKGKK